MTDKQLIRYRFSRASTNYHVAAVAQGKIAAKMMALILNIVRSRPQKLLEIGCGTGHFSRLLLQHLKPKKMILNDICPQMINEVMDLLKTSHIFICADAETYPLPKGLDLIASCSTVQWFDDPYTFFKKCHSALHNFGLLAFSTFGKENMHEIYTTVGVGLTYRSSSELVAALIALHYDILTVHEEHLILYFDNPLQVLKHLKQTGVTGIKNHQWTKGKLEAYSAAYTCKYRTAQGVSLTYHPIYIIAKKQQ